MRGGERVQSRHGDSWKGIALGVGFTSGLSKTWQTERGSIVLEREMEPLA
jgi:hypothetical protein